jgi:thiol-disulfide isomerase/thioredoxin
VLDIAQTAPAIPGFDPGTDAVLIIVFFETDCPTCRLAVPYLNKLARRGAELAYQNAPE